MSICLKNSSSVPSQTEPPRGTIASPNTVMTIDPVRDGSRLSCSTMRASGCGMPQRIPRFFDSRKRRRVHADLAVSTVVMPGLVPGIHVFVYIRKKDVDGPATREHDRNRM